MSFEVIPLAHFSRRLKKLAKKHASIKDDIANLVQELKENPTSGKHIKNNSYKVRMGITSKGVGKSKGARLITHLKIIDEQIFLLTIYDKSAQSTISEKEIDNLIKQIED